MTELVIESGRGEVVESVHRVSAAVCDADGGLIASSGDPHRVTHLRSAAKPFQALPLIEDGAARRFSITREELALACASHNSEKRQVELVRAFVERIGCTEDDLACRAHRRLTRDLTVPHTDGYDPTTEDPFAGSRYASNCSGKHAGMLALAKHHGWDTAGYHERAHPVQDRVKRALAEYTGLAASEIGEGVDGCGVVAFAVPLSSMARACARLVSDSGEAPKAVVSAMTTHPDLIGGRLRLCTEVMQAYPGRVLAKVGAEGVYVAAVIDRGLGLALKVEDGHSKAVMVALIAILGQLRLDPPPTSLLPRFAGITIPNTRGETVGVMRPVGRLSFL